MVSKMGCVIITDRSKKRLNLPDEEIPLREDLTASVSSSPKVSRCEAAVPCKKLLIISFFDKQTPDSAC